MELVDRYIYAVTKRLPHKQRSDIEKELRGLIEDMLAERCGDRTPEKADIEAILKELGEPSKLAGKYRDEKSYLIGPELFHTYLLVLKIVMTVVIFGVALGKSISLFVNPPLNIAQGLGELIAAVISGAFQSFTWVTVIFAANERFAFNKKAGLEEKDWSPSDLQQIPKKEALIKPSEAIVGIIFAVLFIVLFNFASGLIGAYYFEGGKVVSVVPIFAAEGLKQFLPLITVSYCLAILKECAKLIVGKWTLVLGVTSAVLSLVSLVFCAVIFTNPAVWNANFVSGLYTSGIASANMNVRMETIWNGVTKGFIYVAAFGFIIDALVSVIKGIKYGR